MPNWCENTVTISHTDPSLVKRAAEAFNQGRLCQEFLPISDIPKTENYLEAIDYWGTKWDVGGEGNSDAHISEDGLTVSFWFDSAWSPPIGLYRELVRLGFEVRAEYFEPGECFIGRFINGSDEYYEYTPDNIDGVIPEDLAESFGVHDWYDVEDTEESAEAE